MYMLLQVPQARMPGYLMDHTEPVTVTLEPGLLLLFPGNVPRQPRCEGAATPSAARSGSAAGNLQDARGHVHGSKYSASDTCVYITFDIVARAKIPLSNQESARGH